MQLYTKSQFASLVCRDERTIERWIAKGKIVPGRLPSGAPVFSQTHLDAILAGQHDHAAPADKPLTAQEWAAQRRRRKKWRR